jgi:DNA-directed RNA polymerase specialized sigma24 family protein
METVLDRPINDVALSEPLDQEAAVIDFSVCYVRELSSLVWFVMSLGADAHRAADVAQSAFAEAFVVWDRGSERWDPHALALSATLRTRIAG